jgi:transcriptional antiterminator
MAREQDSKDEKSKGKERKGKQQDVLVGRIKKAIKKSRRELSEEKFEKQLQRTIAFLEEIQSKLNESQNSVSGNSVDKQKKAKVASVNKQTKTLLLKKRNKGAELPAKSGATSVVKTK